MKTTRLEYGVESFLSWVFYGIQQTPQSGKGLIYKIAASSREETKGNGSTSGQSSDTREPHANVR